MNIVAISNICFEPYWKTYVHDHNCDAQLKFIPYDECLSYTDDIINAGIITVCLNFDVLYPNASIDLLLDQIGNEVMVEDCIVRCNELYSYIRANTNAHLVWFGFEDYYNQKNFICGNTFASMIDQINLKLSKMLESDTFIDLQRLIATIGTSKAYDNKGKYRWNAPYSKEMVYAMGTEIQKQHCVSAGISPKCIVLDCDNVLWGGILSEDGIEGIKLSSSGLGRPYQDFQRFLLWMYYHGVILTVCSKNDESDVVQVFREHTGMLLKEEHISCFKCNWEDKARNIRSIAESLNIGLDSMVFVDDSNFEIEAVKSILPTVTTILYHRDTVYRDLSCFNLKINVDNQTIKARTNAYRTNAKREELKNKSSSMDEYLAFLNVRIDIHETIPQELMRIAELTQRTNKCTNGVRYTTERLRNKIDSGDYELYTVCLSDIFSDLGVVGVIGISGSSVDLFSLSCRALGRRVENEMIQYILNKNITMIRMIDTGKNENMRYLFKASGVLPKE